jgi:hypothetical protein
LDIEFCGYTLREPIFSCFVGSMHKLRDGSACI